MNKDHPEAVNAYAKYYGKMNSFRSAKMISLSPKSIHLKIDDQTLEIKFEITTHSFHLSLVYKNLNTYVTFIIY